MENAGYKEPEVKNFTGFSDDELVYIYHRLNCNGAYFNEAYRKSVSDYNESYIANDDHIELFRQVIEETLRRNINTTKYHLRDKVIFNLPQAQTAEVLSNGNVIISYNTIPYETIKEINRAARIAKFGS